MIGYSSYLCSYLFSSLCSNEHKRFVREHLEFYVFRVSVPDLK